jgi:hypothetical protein
VAETLAEFIARRRRELDEAEERLKAELVAIGRERLELSAAEGIKLATDDGPRTETYKRRRKKIKPGTIMSDVISILRESPKGMIALDILSVINRRREYPLSRTSLSPQLSRLKGAGYVELQGSNWILKFDGTA